MEGDEALTHCLWGLLRLDSPLQTVLSPRRKGEGVRSAQNYYIYIASTEIIDLKCISTPAVVQFKLIDTRIPPLFKIYNNVISRRIYIICIYFSLRVGIHPGIYQFGLERLNEMSSFSGER